MSVGRAYGEVEQFIFETGTKGIGGENKAVEVCTSQRSEIITMSSSGSLLQMGPRSPHVDIAIDVTGDRKTASVVAMLMR